MVGNDIALHYTIGFIIVDKLTFGTIRNKEKMEEIRMVEL